MCVDNQFCFLFLIKSCESYISDLHKYTKVRTIVLCGNVFIQSLFNFIPLTTIYDAIPVSLRHVCAHASQMRMTLL